VRNPYWRLTKGRIRGALAGSSSPEEAARSLLDLDLGACLFELRLDLVGLPAERLP
jgi:hypothetical protein